MLSKGCLAFPRERHVNIDRAPTALFMLVSALMGLERMEDVYAHAIENEYRLYAYGPGLLLIPCKWLS